MLRPLSLPRLLSYHHHSFGLVIHLGSVDKYKWFLLVSMHRVIEVFSYVVSLLDFFFF